MGMASNVTATRSPKNRLRFAGFVAALTLARRLYILPTTSPCPEPTKEVRRTS